MLIALSIRDLVLIERLDLDLEGGFTALTGETGAGKSILMDALGLACGRRVDRGLIRRGASEASATAVFRLDAAHPVRAILADLGFMHDDEDLVLRRVLMPDGRTKSYLNDAPVTAGLLQRVGDTLVEVFAQHDALRLASPDAQRDALDSFSGAMGARSQVGTAYADVVTAREALKAAQDDIEQTRKDAEWRAFAIEDLSALAPEAGEETSLIGERAFLMGAEKTRSALQDASAALCGDGGPEGRLALAMRALDRAGRMAEAGGGETAVEVFRGAREAAEALDRAIIEAEEARGLIDASLRLCGGDPRRLEALDDRLASLRSMGRKYAVAPDALYELLLRLEAQSTADAEAGAHLAVLEADVERAEALWTKRGAKLSALRTSGAKAFGAAVARELGPLKLGKVKVRVVLEAVPGGQSGALGFERIRFELETNPGAGFGPLDKVASGGEIARIALALRVALNEREPAARTLVFDEIDQGVGGAVADAIGARLSRLGETGQTLAVTHAAQVAARADAHLMVSKTDGRRGVVTSVRSLCPDQRTEEIARMLAGAAVTPEARAAATRLIAAE
jgi:DNA repair protein RecN (Recombination protein N)